MMNNTGYNIFPNLVSIDGPDGTGKSSLSEIITEKMQNIFGHDKVIRVKPTYFNTSVQAQALESLLERCDQAEYSKEHNSIYLEAMRFNNQEVIVPALKNNKFIILDSSEIRALAFIAAKGTDSAIADTAARINSGWLTAFAFPKTRFVLYGQAIDIWKNLQKKNFLDKGDPQNIKETISRIAVYQYAVNFVKGLLSEYKISWNYLEIKNTNDNLPAYLNSLIDNYSIIENMSACL